MFRPFQVNEGRFLPLEQDLPPTARVSELCSAVRAVSNEAEEDQVMLTSDGVQMNPSEIIGSYSVGTEGKPIFLFYRSYLNSSQPPVPPSRLPRRGDFKLQLELLQQKPTPSLFQNLVVLSKRLSEYGLRIGGLCGQLSEEYQLQYSGWCTALANCDAIIKTYHKHHKLFSKEVGTFRSTKPEYLELLQEFPQKVQLLQQLPIPSALQNQNPASSLYDWINTHDERNSLLDLSNECKKTLSNIESSSIEAALLATHQITEEASKLHSQDDQFHKRVKELTALAKKTTELTDTVVALAQNIQSTSDRAYRYGDASTIADLVVSHHKSLQMMSENCAQLEAQAKEAEKSKATLTRFIHIQLKQVAKLQERVAHSNSQLLLLHEHIKLAKKRFEVLRQVCHTPQVLAHVLSEVDRRTAFNNTLEKRAEEAGSCLKQAREEEKRLRRAFVTNYGQHFISTLFPELMERVPDVSIHHTRLLSKSSQAYHSDLERLRQLLPAEMRPSPASASMQLLSSPLLTSLSLGSPRGGFFFTNTESGANDRGETKMLVESSVQTSASLGPSEGKLKLEGLLKKMESDNNELRDQLSSCVIEKEQAKQQLKDRELANMTVVSSLEMEKTQLQHELKKCHRELSSKVEEKVNCISQLESTNRELLKKANQAEEKLKHLESANQVMVHKVQLLDEELKQLTVKNVQLSTELTQRTTDVEVLESRHRDLSSRHEVEISQYHDTVSRLETSNRQLCLQNESSKAEIVQLQESISHLESTNKVHLMKKEAELTEREKEKSELEYKVTQYSTELKKCQLEKESLTVEVERLSSTNSALQLKERETKQLSSEVEEAKDHREKLKKERDLLFSDNQNLKDQCKKFEEEQLRQTSRHQQAQNALSGLRTQVTAVESKLGAAKAKVDSLQHKLEASQKEVDNMQMKLRAAEGKVKELQSQMSSKEVQHLKSLQAVKAEKETMIKTNIQLQENVKVHTEEKAKLERKLKAVEQKLKEVSEKFRDEAKKLNSQIQLKEVQKLESIQAEKSEKEAVMKTKCQLQDKVTVLTQEKTELQRKLETVKQNLSKVTEKFRDEVTELNSQLQLKELQKLESVETEKAEKETMIKRNKELQEKVKALTEEKMKIEKRMKVLVKEETEKVKEMKKKWEEAYSLSEVLGNERNLLKKKLSEKESELENITSERDSYHKQAMEQEREVKELHRSLDHDTTQRLLGPGSPVKTEPQLPTAGAKPTASVRKITVSIAGLKDGDIALFISDLYDNYIALVSDEKIYYLNQGSIPKLTDLGILVPQLNLQRKVLIGRIIGRMHVEVRKEGNRLKVPVGTRMYKLDAESVQL